VVAASAFPANGFFFARGVPASVFANAALDGAVPRSAESLGVDGFNCFDGALCDAFGEALWAGLTALLSDLLAAARRIFEDGVFADLFD